MRIILLAPLPPPVGGMSMWTLKYLEHAKKVGLNVELVDIALKGRRSRDITLKRSLCSEIVRSIMIRKELMQKLRRGADVIHFNSCCSKFGIFRDAYLIRVCRRKKVPILLECHSNIESQLGHSAWPYKAFRRAVINSSLVVVLNQRSQKFVESIVEKNKIVVLPNFIDDSFLQHYKQLREYATKAVFVGHVTKEKGILDLFEVANIVKNISFDIIGKIDRTIDISLAPPNVNILGELPSKEVTKAMDNSDFLFFPSHTEGFSLVMLESMSRGIPIIASDVGANFEMVENHGGFIISSGDIKGFVNAIQKISNVGIRREMSNWNLNKVRNNYLSSVVLKKFEDLYIQLSRAGKTR